MQTAGRIGVFLGRAEYAFAEGYFEEGGDGGDAGGDDDGVGFDAGPDEEVDGPVCFISLTVDWLVDPGGGREEYRLNRGLCIGLGVVCI